jgi:hypothetical protein
LACRNRETLASPDRRAAVVILGVAVVIAALKWMRRQHCRTFVLMRAMAIHMIQNRPSTDDQQRLQENLNWWEAEVVRILPKAGATPGEIGDFSALGKRLSSDSDRREDRPTWREPGWAIPRRTEPSQDLQRPDPG